MRAGRGRSGLRTGGGRRELKAARSDLQVRARVLGDRLSRRVRPAAAEDRLSDEGRGAGGARGRAAAGAAGAVAAAAGDAAPADERVREAVRRGAVVDRVSGRQHAPRAGGVRRSADRPATGGPDRAVAGERARRQALPGDAVVAAGAGGGGGRGGGARKNRGAGWG